MRRRLAAEREKYSPSHKVSPGEYRPSTDPFPHAAEETIATYRASARVIAARGATLSFHPAKTGCRSLGGSPAFGVTLLAEMHEAARAQRERLRLEVRELLRTALHDLLPGTEVMVFGSLTRPFGFGPQSDIDVAVSSVPSGMSLLRLQAEIEERLERRVDLIDLAACRFSAKIAQEGERWIG